MGLLLIALLLGALLLAGCGLTRRQGPAVDVNCDEFAKVQHVERVLQVASGKIDLIGSTLHFHFGLFYIGSELVQLGFKVELGQFVFQPGFFGNPRRLVFLLVVIAA